MAINIRVEDGLPISVEQAQNILQSESDRFGLFIDMDRCIEYELYFRQHRDSLTEELGKFCNNKFTPSQRGEVRDWFMSAFDIPERLMRNKANKIAFDKFVIANLMDANISEDAKNYLKLYQEWNYYAYRVNYLKQYMSLPISFAVSTEGHRMVRANPKWVILSTSRLAAQNPSLQNIARDMSDLVCCPEGWELYRCDSGQIEPRITYSHYVKDQMLRDLIILYNDAYYGTLHYCTLSEEVYQNRDMYVVEGDEHESDYDAEHIIHKKEITDEMKEGRKELKVIALAATYGSALAGRDPVLSKRYVERIVNHPDRKRWETEVQAQVARGNEVFYSVFGSKIVPDDTAQYTRGTKSWDAHIVRCGINNPIQATASDLMVCSVNEAYKILQNCEKSHIAYYKHDEGAFYIHDSEKEIIDVLKDVTAYNVTENGQPWIPIHAELEIGQKRCTGVPSVLDWR